MKKLICIFGSFTIFASSISNLASYSKTNINLTNNNNLSTSNSLNEKQFSNVSQELTNLFNEESNQKTYSTSSTTYYQLSGISSDDVFKYVYYNQEQKQLDININNLYLAGATNELIKIVESIDFHQELNFAFSKDIFYLDDENNVVYNDNLPVNNKQIKNITQGFEDDYYDNNLPVINDEDIIKPFFNVYGASPNDFWTVSHWYWFGYKRFEMNNAGRKWFINISNINIYTNLGLNIIKIGANVIKALVRFVSESFTELWAFIMKIIILVVNTILFVTCLWQLSTYESGAYIRYFGITGTIFGWGVR